MTSAPARGPQGPGPTSPSSGLTAYELIVSLMVVAFLVMLAAPGTLSLRESVSIRNAVHETTVAFYLARSYAVARDRNVGLKFRRNGDRYEWALYGDGNGNGIRTAEIASGVDRFLGIAYPWSRNDVRPAIMTGIACPIRAALAATWIGSMIRSDSTIPTSAPSLRSATRRRAPSTSGTRTIGWPSCACSARRRRSGRSTTGGEREAGLNDHSDRATEREREEKAAAGARSRSEKGFAIVGSDPGSPRACFERKAEEIARAAESHVRTMVEQEARLLSTPAPHELEPVPAAVTRTPCRSA